MYDEVAKRNPITKLCERVLGCGNQYTIRITNENTRHFGFKYKGVPNSPPPILHSSRFSYDLPFREPTVKRPSVA